METVVKFKVLPDEQTHGPGMRHVVWVKTDGILTNRDFSAQLFANHFAQNALRL